VDGFARRELRRLASRRGALSCLLQQQGWSERSSVGFLETDLARPGEILAISRGALLGPGDRGGFDDSGVSLGWIVHAGDLQYLYYLGWNLGRYRPVSQQHRPGNRQRRGPAHAGLEDTHPGSKRSRPVLTLVSMRAEGGRWLEDVVRPRWSGPSRVPE
jgi:hypothetical protein